MGFLCESVPPTSCLVVPIEAGTWSPPEFSGSRWPNPKREFLSFRDAAKSWTRLESVWRVPWIASVGYPVARMEPHIRDITVDPKDGSTICDGVYHSGDDGESWTNLEVRVPPISDMKCATM